MIPYKIGMLLITPCWPWESKRIKLCSLVPIGINQFFRGRCQGWISFLTDEKFEILNQWRIEYSLSLSKSGNGNLRVVITSSCLLPLNSTWNCHKSNSKMLHSMKFQTSCFPARYSWDLSTTVTKLNSKNWRLTLTSPLGISGSSIKLPK
jgi:hypothetical protein